MLGDIHGRKFLFLHIPKVAGQSIKTALMQYRLKDPIYRRLWSKLSSPNKRYSSGVPRELNGHPSLGSYRSYLKSSFDDYFKFALLNTTLNGL